MTELQLFYTQEDVDRLQSAAYLRGYNEGYENARERYAPCEPVSLEYELTDPGGNLLKTFKLEDELYE